MKYHIKITAETNSEDRVVEIINAVWKNAPREQCCDMDGREIISVSARNKTEAIAGLEMLLDTIKNSYYNEAVSERVLVTNEGVTVDVN